MVFLWYTFCQNTNSFDDLKSTKITIVQGDFRITFWIQYFVSLPFASMIAFMTLGMRSMSFWVGSIGRVFQTCSSAFFHICIVRLWLAFFSPSFVWKHLKVSAFSPFFQEQSTASIRSFFRWTCACLRLTSFQHVWRISQNHFNYFYLMISAYLLLNKTPTPVRMTQIMSCN